MRALILTPLLLLGCGTASARAVDAAAPDCRSLGEQWDRLLLLNLRHDLSALEEVRELKRAADCEAVGGLADVILQEWYYSQSDERLHRPRIVAQPPMVGSEIKDRLSANVQAQIVVIQGRVDPCGKTKAPELLSQSEYEEVNSAAKAAFLKALYRPARRGGEYVPAEVQLVYRLDVQ